MHTYIGKIPLQEFIEYALKRKFNQDLLILYVEENYGIDISNDLDIIEYKKYDAYEPENIYEKFNKEHPCIKEDDGTRKYFDSYGRNRFCEFLESINQNDNDYAVINNWSIIHHIYSLVYSKDNSLQNLLQVSNFTHKILHMNSLGGIRKYCYQAVDYYYYLVNFRGDYLYNKYNLSYYDNMPMLLEDIVCAVIRYEMHLFYKYLKLKHKEECS